MAQRIVAPRRNARFAALLAFVGAAAIPAISSVLVGCGGGGASASWPGAVCDSRLAAAPIETSRASHLEPPVSRVLVDVRVDGPAALAELAARIPKRLAERRNVSIGAGGLATFAIDRGPFALGVEGDDAFVALDVAAAASFCKPLGPLGCVEYASCRPAAHVVASVPLVLDRSYRFGPARVSLRPTRPCTLTALGIDVTDEIMKNARHEADVARDTIDRSIPSVEPVAASVWSTLGTSVPIGLRACVRAVPIAVVEGGPHGVDGAPAIPIGVEGHVTVESPCRAGKTSPPMPPPRFERALGPGFELAIPIVIAWDEATRAATRSVALAEPRAGGETIHFEEIQLFPRDDDTVLVHASIAGHVCGELGFAATLALSGDTIALASVTPLDGELERARAIAPRLDVAVIARTIADRVRIPLPIDASAVPKRLDGVAEALFSSQDPHAPVVDVTTEAARIERTAPVAEGIVAILRATGTASVTLR